MYLDKEVRKKSEVYEENTSKDLVPEISSIYSDDLSTLDKIPILQKYLYSYEGYVLFNVFMKKG